MYEIANSDCTGGIGKRAQTRAAKMNEGGQAQKTPETNKGSKGKQQQPK